MFARWIARLSLFLMEGLGWRFQGVRPQHRKFVLIGAPHTSVWDFPLTLALMARFSLPLRYFVKDSLFRPPWGALMRSLGALPVDRSRHANLVDAMVAQLAQEADFALGILPEGTRKWTPRWKSGFYHIARGAGLPVIPARVDGKKKTVTLGPALDLSGEIERDREALAQFYEGAQACATGGLAR